MPKVFDTPHMQNNDSIAVNVVQMVADNRSAMSSGKDRLSVEVRLPSGWSHPDARALIREHYGVEPEEILENAFSDALREKQRIGKEHSIT
jgi:hypothetical protein